MNIEALKELERQIAAGTGYPEGDGMRVYQFNAFCDLWEGAFGLTDPHRGKAFRAYKGSLDAAIELHHALCPEFSFDLGHWPGKQRYIVRLGGTHEMDGERWYGSSDIKIEAISRDLARAWLLAIIRALIAGEQG